MRILSLLSLGAALWSSSALGDVAVVGGDAAPPGAGADPFAVPADDISASLAALSVSLAAPGGLHATTRAVLTTAGRAPLVAPLDRRNRCIFPAVPPGSYLLEVVSREFSFEPARVDVRPDGSRDRSKDQAVRIEAWQTFRGHAWGNTGERLGSGKGTLDISPRFVGPRNVFAEREGFNPLALLRSPMILIGVAGLVMMIGMPKLMENMDPETRKEFEEHQRNSALSGMASGNPMGNFDPAAWMAGKQGASSGADTSSGGGGGEKGMKRS